MRSKTREEMIAEDLEAREVHDRFVLAAVANVERAAFLPPALESEAYEDQPLPIGRGVTVSQPYIVAYMTQLARVRPGFKVLEIGTASGYQAALLAQMGASVDTVELDPVLAARARRALHAEGFGEVRVHVGDGWLGHEAQAPYDVILVTAAASEVAPAWLEQLEDEGRLVLPLGGGSQVLTVITRDQEAFITRRIGPVAFTPLRRV